MTLQKYFIKITLVSLPMFLWYLSSAQLCINSYSSTIYRSINFDTFITAATTINKEIVVAGNTKADNGIMTKFSSKGTVLYSYQYNPAYQFDLTFYKPLKFVKTISTKDGATVTCGSIIKDKYYGLNETLNNIGVLIKNDKYGNLLWSKKFESLNGTHDGGFEVSIADVIETTSGDLVIYLSADYSKNYQGYGKLICLDKNGNLRWKTLLATNDYDGGILSLQTKRGFCEAINGSIIVADIVYKTQKNDFGIITIASQLHLLSVNASSGNIKWETNYKYPLDNTGGHPDVADVFELNNGNFIVNLSSYESSACGRFRFSDKGIFQNGVLYSLAGNVVTTLASTIKINTDDRLYLLCADKSSAIACINRNGVVLWQKGYDNSNGKFPANCFTSIDSNYAIMMSNFKSWESRLLLTDTNGNINCINIPVSINATPVTLQNGDPLLTEPNISDQNNFAISDFPMKLLPYSFKKTIECVAQASCCYEEIDTSGLINPISICEESNYLLPDNSIVNQTGTYFIVYKTQGGCDSIKYLRVIVNKNPSSLSLGSNVCFDGKDSILLIATDGYELYKWMNETPTEQRFYKITTPGDYYVNVTNICGTKTDTITAFKNCDFPIYMPNAFTPNGDGKNDLFKVPLQNKNEFISLKIFNRFGQVVFYTTDVYEGWDGKNDGNILDSQTFIYYLQSKGLTGKLITQKGAFLLLR